jgi:hypothetical protein
MDIIPLIRMRKRKMSSNLSKKEIFEIIPENHMIYILDLDGIDKDKPNLCTFQKSSSDYELWVDFGPRNLGDMVDAFMTGVERVTIRPNLWPNLNIAEIRDISENKVFINIDFDKDQNIRDVFDYGSDGVVTLIEKNIIDNNFKNSDYLRQYGLKKDLYSYENDPKNINYWKSLGVKTLLIDVDKYMDFKKWIRK